MPWSGYLRSQSTYTHGVIEMVAQFGAGAWEHIGFGSDGFKATGYFLFSTYTGDGNLYARVNNNTSEQRVNLGPIPSGMHRYRIEWVVVNATTDGVNFYVDGVLVAQMTVSNTGASNFYLYLSNAGTANLLVDQAQVTPPYVASGTYTSCALDAGVGSTWQTVAWNATVGTGTGLTVQTRKSSDGVNWGVWTAAVSGGALGTPAALPPVLALYDHYQQPGFASDQFSHIECGLNDEFLHLQHCRLHRHPWRPLRPGRRFRRRRTHPWRHTATRTSAYRRANKHTPGAHCDQDVATDGDKYTPGAHCDQDVASDGDEHTPGAHCDQDAATNGDANGDFGPFGNSYNNTSLGRQDQQLTSGQCAGSGEREI